MCAATVPAAMSQATAAGGDHSLNPDSPWEWVHRETAHDTRFWRTDGEEPALLIEAQVARMSVSTGRNAPLNERHARPTVLRNNPHQQRTKRTWSQGERIHQADDEGEMTHSRRGWKL